MPMHNSCAHCPSQASNSGDCKSLIFIAQLYISCTNDKCFCFGNFATFWLRHALQIADLLVNFLCRVDSHCALAEMSFNWMCLQALTMPCQPALPASLAARLSTPAPAQPQGLSPGLAARLGSPPTPTPPSPLPLSGTAQLSTPQLQTPPVAPSTPPHNPSLIANTPPAASCTTPGPNGDSPVSAVSLLVRLGFDGQQRWSQTITCPGIMTIATVWTDCATYLGIDQGCCSSAVANGQPVTAAGQSLATFGNGSTIDFILSSQGSHLVHLTMVDVKKSSVRAVFLRVEQVGPALQRWAESLHLPFSPSMFLRQGQQVDMLASFCDLGFQNGDELEVLGANQAATSSSGSAADVQVSMLAAFLQWSKVSAFETPQCAIMLVCLATL